MKEIKELIAKYNRMLKNSLNELKHCELNIVKETELRMEVTIYKNILEDLNKLIK